MTTLSGWTASTSYSIGDVVRATTTQASGLVFKCIDAGMSGSSEPDWPRSFWATNGRTAALDGVNIGGTVVDGGCIWGAVSSIYEELSKLNPSTIIEFYELRLSAAIHGSSEVKRFYSGINEKTTGTTSAKRLKWAGNSYEPWPVIVDGFEQSGGGQLPRPTITLANLIPTTTGSVNGTISAMLATVNATTPGNDFTGAEFARIRTMARYLDDSNFDGSNPYGTADAFQSFPEDVFLVTRKSIENRQIVQFELRSVLDFPSIRCPKRLVLPDEFPGIGGAFV